MGSLLGLLRAVGRQGPEPQCQARVSLSPGSVSALSLQSWWRPAWHCRAVGARAFLGWAQPEMPMASPREPGFSQCFSGSISRWKAWQAAGLPLPLYIAIEMNIYVHEIST